MNLRSFGPLLTLLLVVSAGSFAALAADRVLYGSDVGLDDLVDTGP